MKTIILMILTLAFPVCLQASVTVTGTDGPEKKDISSVKIYYIGDVTEKGITELISSLEEINATWTDLKRIWIYNNSRGRYGQWIYGV